MRIALSEVNAVETSTLLPAKHLAKIVATKGVVSAHSPVKDRKLLIPVRCTTRKCFFVATKAAAPFRALKCDVGKAKFGSIRNPVIGGTLCGPLAILLEVGDKTSGSSALNGAAVTLAASRQGFSTPLRGDMPGAHTERKRRS